MSRVRESDKLGATEEVGQCGFPQVPKVLSV